MARDGRRMAAVVILVGALVLAWLSATLGAKEAFRIFGVGKMDGLFADLRLFPAAQETLAAGGDPSVSNPSDPWGRAYNYPACWLWFMRFPAAWVPALGFGLIGLTLAVAWAWAGRLDRRQGLVAGVFLVSAPLVLAFDRGNSDLIVFALLGVALIGLAHGGRARFFAACLGVFALKLYPVVALLALAERGWRRAWRWWVAGGVVVLGYVVVRQAELVQIAKNTPDSWFPAYGARVCARLVERFLELPAGASAGQGRAAMAVAAAGGAAMLWLGWRSGLRAVAAGAEAEGTARHRAGFLVGAAIYTGTFIAGNSFDYRLVFLFFCLPWLAGSGEEQAGSVRRWRMMATGCLLGVVWANPYWWLPLVVVGEVFSWGLFLFLAALIGHVVARGSEGRAA